MFTASILLINGFAVGGLYALLAMGLVIVFKGSGVVNFAHGALFTISAYLAFSLLKFGLSYFLSIFFAIILTTLIGVIIERIAFRPLIKTADPLIFKGATIACAFIIIGLIRWRFGGLGDYLSLPPLYSFEPIFLGKFIIPSQQLVIIICVTLIMLIFGAFFNYSGIGRLMQAVAEDSEASKVVGINVDRIFLYIWGVGSCLGAFAGVLMAPVTLIYPDMGLIMLVKAVAAAVVGGFDRLGGAIVGGMILGLSEVCLGFLLGTQYQDVIGFIIIIFILIFMPRGLFGSKNLTRV
jgi:branched-chain amino acid transport system permease protein